jgi:hypothetical protein
MAIDVLKYEERKEDDKEWFNKKCRQSSLMFCDYNSVYLVVCFWVIHQQLKFICHCFRTLCLFHLHRRVGIKCDWD